MEFVGAITPESPVIDGEAEYTYGITIQAKPFHPVNVGLTIRKKVKTAEDVAKLQTLVEGIVNDRVARIAKEGWPFPEPPKR